MFKPRFIHVHIIIHSVVTEVVTLEETELTMNSFYRTIPCSFE